MQNGYLENSKCQAIYKSHMAGDIDLEECLFRMALVTKDYINEYVALRQPSIGNDLLTYVNQRCANIGEPSKEYAVELGDYINIFSKNHTRITASIKDLDSDLAILAKKNITCEVIEKKLNELLKVLSEYDLKFFSDALRVLENDSRKYN